MEKTHNEKRKNESECRNHGKYEKITKEQVFELINAKVDVHFNGKLTFIFKAGEILTIEKMQRMNTQRVGREIKRDNNFIGSKNGQ